MLAGVGGQGILFATGVLTQLALRNGWPVMGAETHGMAQRGGSVVSHLKMQRPVAAPLIRRGSADLLIGLEENEGLRNLPFLRRGGTFLLEQGQGKLELEPVQSYLQAQRIVARSVPASRLAGEMGFPLGANLIILGAAQGAGWIPFTRREMEKVVAGLSSRAILEPNLQSLRCGWETVSEIAGPVRKARRAGKKGKAPVPAGDGV